MANPRDEKPVLHTKKHIARLEREPQQTRLILFIFIWIIIDVAGLIAYSIIFTKYLQAKVPVAKVGTTSIPLAEWQARVQLERQKLAYQYNYYQQLGQFGVDVSSQLAAIQ